MAVVGYPNVGKSTLVNRLSGTREAVVHEQAGVTRDRKEVEADWNGRRLHARSTPAAWTSRRRATWPRRCAARRGRRWRRPTLALLVVDARAGLRPGDAELARELRGGRRAGDRGRQQGGRGQPDRAWPPSSTGSASATRCRSRPRRAWAPATCWTLVDRLACSPSGEAPTRTTRLAVIGRPNVGKSSLVNKLLGEERVIVTDVAGTTRDSIDTRIEFEGRPVTLVDTAGLRRRTKVAGTVDYYAQLRSERAAERAAVAIVLCDASEGVTTEDFRIAELAMKKQVRHGDRAEQVGRSPTPTSRTPRRACTHEAAPAPAGDGGLGAHRPRAEAPGRRGARTWPTAREQSSRPPSSTASSATSRRCASRRPCAASG